MIYKRPGIRCHYDRRRSVEGGCGEEREGLGRGAAFQGRGRRNVTETSVRTDETPGEKRKKCGCRRRTDRVKESTFAWGFFSKGTEVRMATSAERGRRCEPSAPAQ